jgi:hypothetical protein
VFDRWWSLRRVVLLIAFVCAGSNSMSRCMRSSSLYPPNSRSLDGYCRALFNRQLFYLSLEICGLVGELSRRQSVLQSCQWSGINAA